MTSSLSKRILSEPVTVKPKSSPEGMIDQDILDRLPQRMEGKYLIVADCRFSSARRYREAIRRLAVRAGKTLLTGVCG
jgi:hypothetical protein